MEEPKKVCTTIDSGLSSEEDARRDHLSSSSSSSNDEIKNTAEDSQSEKSSYSEKQEKESMAKEDDRLQGKFSIILDFFWDFVKSSPILSPL